MSNQSTRWAWLVCGLIGLTAAGVFAQTTVTISTSGTGTQSTGTQPVGTAPATSRPETGDARIAQQLAKTELAQAGITHPTQAQMQAALNGGTVTRANGTKVVFKGVVTQHQSGMGWGQIANSLGVKLGKLVSASHSEHAGKKTHHKSEQSAHDHTGDHKHHTETSNHVRTAEAAHSGDGSHSGSSGGASHSGKK